MAESARGFHPRLLAKARVVGVAVLAGESPARLRLDMVYVADGAAVVLSVRVADAEQEALVG